MMRRFAAVSALAAAALAGVAVSAAIGFGGNPVVGLRTTPLGSVLAAANGRTLYLFTADTTKGSACNGACASVWKPLLATGSLAAGAGVRSSLLGTVKRKDGTLQVTYAGHPLYLFAQDAKAGQTKGQGGHSFGGRWWVVSPKGIKVVAANPPGSGPVIKPPHTTTNSSPGYTP